MGLKIISNLRTVEANNFGGTIDDVGAVNIALLDVCGLLVRLRRIYELSRLLPPWQICHIVVPGTAVDHLKLHASVITLTATIGVQRQDSLDTATHRQAAMDHPSTNAQASTAPKSGFHQAASFVERALSFRTNAQRSSAPTSGPNEASSSAAPTKPTIRSALSASDLKRIDSFPAVPDEQIQRLLPGEDLQDAREWVRAALQEMHLNFDLDPKLLGEHSDANRGNALLALLLSRIVVSAPDSAGDADGREPGHLSGAVVDQEGRAAKGEASSEAFKSKSAGVAPPREYETHDLLKAIDKKDVETILAIRNANFDLLLDLSQGGSKAKTSAAAAQAGSDVAACVVSAGARHVRGLAVPAFGHRGRGTLSCCALFGCGVSRRWCGSRRTCQVSGDAVCDRLAAPQDRQGRSGKGLRGECSVGSAAHVAVVARQAQRLADGGSAEERGVRKRAGRPGQPAADVLFRTRRPRRIALCCPGHQPAACDGRCRSDFAGQGRNARCRGTYARREEEVVPRTPSDHRRRAQPHEASHKVALSLYTYTLTTLHGMYGDFLP
ncbi:hypothetical protein L1887_53525 [Cichorium endivia]|nr:hypothetical protein L1887_53525 [Cichorium endivia]